MTDFHRSLDRAIDEPGHHHWFDEAYLYQGPVDSSIVDTFEMPPAPTEEWASFGAIQKEINRGIVRLAQVSLTPALFVEEPEPASNMLEAQERAFADRGWATSVPWLRPATVTLEARRVSIEKIEAFIGQRLIPLCDRVIPAEGVE